MQKQEASLYQDDKPSCSIHLNSPRKAAKEGGAAATFGSLTPKAAGQVFPRGQSTQGKQAAALTALCGDNLRM
uniref:hypothetical protein n=1 Tax=Serratia proteamaculans TaxID=28151 RepID=UPI001F4BD58B|nr:hypothetical protein [Serratia proteamaculans]